MKISLIGASGRMGRELICAMRQQEDMQLVAALVKPSSPFLGEDIGLFTEGKPFNIPFTALLEEALARADIVIDFSTPKASIEAVSWISKTKKIPYICGTTGFTIEQEDILQTAAKTMPLLQSGNMSWGVNFLYKIIKQAAKILPQEEFDIEIFEMHHRNKKDAPSGTALLLGEAAAEGRGSHLKNCRVDAHQRTSHQREIGEIGFSSARGGSVVGEHSIIFAGENERLVFSHYAQNRSIFAYGALKAARWLKEQPNGFYTMQDVLEFNDA